MRMGIVAVFLTATPVAAAEDWTPINRQQISPPQRFERVAVGGGYVGLFGGMAALARGARFQTFGVSQSAPAAYFALPAANLDLAASRRMGGDFAAVFGYGERVSTNFYVGGEAVVGFGRAMGRLRAPVNPALGLAAASNPLLGVSYSGGERVGTNAALRLRLGVTPASERFLGYVFAGVSGADIAARGLQVAPISGVVIDPAGQVGAGAPPRVASLEKAGFAVGWTAGFGFEAMLTRAWAVRAEAGAEGYGAPRATAARARVGFVFRP